MNTAECKQYIDDNPEQYLQRDKSGKGYICPICGSGSGDKGTGITSKDGKHFTCWAGCFTNADILDIIGLKEGLNSYAAKLDRAAQIYSLDTTKGHRQPIQLTTTKKQKPGDNKLKDYTAMYQKAASHPQRFAYLLQRGISETVQQAFNIGRLDDYYFAKDYQAPACLIPVDAQHYTARNIEADKTGAGLKVTHKGQAFPLFNWDKAIACDEPVFIVEGEIDALSIIEAGGQAAALCSVTGKAKLLKAANQAANLPPLILALDNDPAGEATSRWLLERLNAYNAAPELYGCHKDANAALCANRAAFIERVKTASLAAKSINLTAFADKPQIFGADSPYIIKEDGSLCYSFVKGDELKERLLGDFYLQGLAAITKDDGVEHREFVKIRPVHKNKPLPALDISMEKFAGLGFASTLPLECRPTIGRNTIDRYRDSVRAQASQMERQTVYLHTGWRQIAGAWYYLYCGGAIPALEATVELSGSLDGRYTFPAKDSPEKFQTLLQWFKLAPGRVVYALLATAFLAPLTEFLTAAGCAPGFLLFLLGKTQSQKSTLAALTLSFFGNFDSMTLPASFNDTPASLENIGFMTKDTLTVIDDYYPESSRSKAGSMNKTIDLLAAAYGDRQGKSRCAPDGTLKPGKPVRGIAIITGEIMPQSAQSRLARHLFVEMKRGSVNLAVLSEIQANQDHLAMVMRDYIAWLAPQAETLPAKLKQVFMEQRQACRCLGRAAAAQASLQVAFRLLLDFLLQAGAITAAEAAAHEAACKKELTELAALHEQIQQDNNPVRLFVNSLNSLLSTGKATLCKLQWTDFTPSPQDNVIGYEDTEYYYLLPEAAFNAVYRHCAEIDMRFPLGRSDLQKELVEAGIIEPGQKRASKLKRIAGRNVRCWFVPQAKLNDNQSSTA